MASSIMALCLFAVVFLYSIIVHEVAHGWAALRCGDTTARDMGRLSLNPLVHIDPFRSIIMPLLIFWMSGYRFILGGAKPVPINPLQFRKLYRDMRLVSLAGVGSNLVLAFVFVQLAKVFRASPYLLAVFGMGGLLNLVLLIFNMLPIPPLDGSRVLATFLPESGQRVLAKIEPFGMFLIILLIFSGLLWPVFFGVLTALWKFVMLADFDLLVEIQKAFGEVIGALS